MRNLLTPAPASRRGSNAGLASTLASPNQSRYKGLISTPGVTKFSAWKRENEIPKTFFHDFLLQKIDEKPEKKLWMKDVSNGRVEEFGNVRKKVSSVASGLSKLGFKEKDVICMYCPNYVDYWLMSLATWTCGGCVMPVNCELEPDDLIQQLTDAKAKIIVCDDLNLNEVLEIVKKTTPEIKTIVGIGTDRKDLGCIPMCDLLDDDGRSAPKRINLNWEKDVIYLPFTSTSGGSMGIMHTHKSLLSSFYSPDNAANHWIDQAIGESLACGNWFFHMTGLYSVTLSAIYGISLYTLSEYSNEAFVEMIVDNKIATASVYPWQIRYLCQSPDMGRFDTSCLRMLITGGSRLSASIRMDLMEKIPTIRYVREGYGLNECGIVCLTYPREKKNSVTAATMVDSSDDHVMPVGLPNMYTMIKIVSRQTGQAVNGPDEQGEICVKSPQCFIGYLKQHEKNKSIFDSDGFFHTGDLGYYDSQGVVYFIECIANLINFWMYEVSPSILEARLLGSGNQILDAAVVGIPNQENGQVPRAFVVLRPGFEETEENLTNLMESRLEDHERIRGGLYFVQDIPRDENWKVRRDILVAYQPKTTEELNKEADQKEAAAAAFGTAVQGNKIDPKAVQAQSKKPVVKELERQANGTFVAAPIAPEPMPSPRTFRANRAKALETKDDKDIVKRDKTPIKELASGSGTTKINGNEPSELAASTSTRKASIDNIPSTGRRPSRGLEILGIGATSTRSKSPRRRSPNQTMSRSRSPAPNARKYKYWMMVDWTPEGLEKIIMSHQAVQDCTVQGFHVEGIGELPRAYVVQKPGYETTSEELLAYVDYRTVPNEKLRAGIVFVDKLAKDPSGKLFISLDRFNKDAEGMDYGFIRKQPKCFSTV